MWNKIEKQMERLIKEIAENMPCLKNASPKILAPKDGECPLFGVMRILEWESPFWNGYFDSLFCSDQKVY